jgi:hypothetical protein
LVAKKSCRPGSSIIQGKDLLSLGIDGDDAVELVDDVCKQYDVPAKKIV